MNPLLSATRLHPLEQTSLRQSLSVCDNQHASLQCTCYKTCSENFLQPWGYVSTPASSAITWLLGVTAEEASFAWFRIQEHYGGTAKLPVKRHTSRGCMHLCDLPVAKTCHPSYPKRLCVAFRVSAVS